MKVFDIKRFSRTKNPYIELIRKDPYLNISIYKEKNEYTLFHIPVVRKMEQMDSVMIHLFLRQLQKSIGFIIK